MWSFITFLLKLLTDKVTSKWVWISLLIVGLPYGLKLSSPTSFKLLTSSIVQSIIIVETFWIRLACFIILAVAIYLLLRKSDSEFRKELQERHPEHKFYSSKESRYIQTTVAEDRQRLEGKRMKRRKICINNKLETAIKYIKGKVIFFEHNVKIFDVPFEETNISIYKGVCISDELVNPEGNKWDWDEFQIQLDKLEYSDNIVENKMLYGLKFYRNSAWILNRYNYRIFGIIRVRYELSWLKNQWNWVVRPRLINYPRLPRIYVSYGYRLPLKEKMEYFWKRKLNQAIWLSIVAPVCTFLYLAFSGFVLVSWNLLTIWFNFSHDLFFKIYT